MTFDQSDELQPHSNGRIHEAAEYGNSLEGAARVEPNGISLAEMIQQHMAQFGEGQMLFDDFARDEPHNA